MLDRFFYLSENRTTFRTELLAGLTTFLTMAYIIFVQPAVLSGLFFVDFMGEKALTGMDFGAVTTATCVAAALATLLMGLFARYPIGLAPGMGENFFFVITLLPAAAAVPAFADALDAGQTTPWQIGLGVVFVAGVLFLIVSALGVQSKLLDAISPSMRAGIAVGIGLFIAFIGLQGAKVVVDSGGTLVKLNPQFASPDLVVFFCGLMVTAGLYALRVRGSIVWGILAATLLAVVLKLGLPAFLPDMPMLPKKISHQLAGHGLNLSLSTGWYDRPGSQPVQVSLTSDEPAEVTRRFTVQLLVRREGTASGYDDRVVRELDLPADTLRVDVTWKAPQLSQATTYALQVSEGDRPRPDLSFPAALSDPWTPVPRLPELVTHSVLMQRFSVAERIVDVPPSPEPTMFKMDWRRALSLSMIPFILIFLFMDVFDTLGTLIGVSEQAGFIKDDKLPRMKSALVSDAVGTVAGAAMGTSTVTSFIESAAGVEQGGRTGLTAVTVALLFVVALFFSPIIAMVGSYPPITAPALVVVGSLMMRNVTKIEWDNAAEVLPSFLIIIGIPMTYSIADGLALGFIAYPVVKLIAGQGRDVRWLMIVMALVLVAYFVLVRGFSGTQY